jgi:hypothetical protein
MVAHPDQGTIEFQAGFISESLSASMFDEVPTCGSSVGAQLRGAAGVIGELGLLPVAQVFLRLNSYIGFKLLSIERELVPILFA